MAVDIEGILARYGIVIECDQEREYLLDLIRRLSAPWLKSGVKPAEMDEAASVLMSLIACPKEQSSYAKNLVGSPDAGPEGRCAPREEFTQQNGDQK